MHTADMIGYRHVEFNFQQSLRIFNITDREYEDIQKDQVFIIETWNQSEIIIRDVGTDSFYVLCDNNYDVLMHT